MSLERRPRNQEAINEADLVNEEYSEAEAQQSRAEYEGMI